MGSVENVTKVLKIESGAWIGLIKLFQPDGQNIFSPLALCNYAETLLHYVREQRATQHEALIWETAFFSKKQPASSY